MEEANYEITLSFDRFSQMGLFIQDFENWLAWKAKRSERRETDQRGLQTKILHQRAREYHAKYPLISYRDSFKLANARQTAI